MYGKNAPPHDDTFIHTKLMGSNLGKDSITRPEPYRVCLMAFRAGTGASSRGSGQEEHACSRCCCCANMSCTRAARGLTAAESASRRARLAPGDSPATSPRKGGGSATADAGGATSASGVACCCCAASCSGCCGCSVCRHSSVSAACLCAHQNQTMKPSADRPAPPAA